MEPRANLAAKHRPRRFAELTGQKHVKAVVSAAIRSDRLPQQIMLAGGSGLGKTTVARIVAACQLCTTSLAERKDGDACGECRSCLLIGQVTSEHPDVVEMDAASHGGKDEIVNLVSRAQTLPIEGRCKIYIIDEVHALTGSGVQAFLKLLEEPPSHVYFMLATTNPEKLSTRAGGTGTIRSRCVELELIPPTREELVDNLHRVAALEGWRLADEVAYEIVKESDPQLGVRGTINTLSKLAGHLSSGDEVDLHMARSLLGSASLGGLSRLKSAVRAGDLKEALDATNEMRKSLSEKAIQEAVASWARSELEEALAGERSVAPEIPLMRMEAALNAGAGPLDTDLMVARLAVPHVAVDQQVLAAQLHEAARILDELDRHMMKLSPLLGTEPARGFDSVKEKLEDQESELTGSTYRTEHGSGRQNWPPAQEPAMRPDSTSSPSIPGVGAEGASEETASHAGSSEHGEHDPAWTFDDLSDLSDLNEGLHPDAGSSEPPSRPADGREKVEPQGGLSKAPEERTPDLMEKLDAMMQRRSVVARAVWSACDKSFSKEGVLVEVPPHLASRYNTVKSDWAGVFEEAGIKAEVVKRADGATGRKAKGSSSE